MPGTCTWNVTGPTSTPTTEIVTHKRCVAVLHVPDPRTAAPYALQSVTVVWLNAWSLSKSLLFGPCR